MFLKDNYSNHQETVDLAAKLSAFGIVNLRVCERWMGGQSLDASLLVPFVGSVELASAAIKRLEKARSRRF